MYASNRSHSSPKIGRGNSTEYESATASYCTLSYAILMAKSKGENAKSIFIN